MAKTKAKDLFPSRYLTGADLQGQQRTFTIKGVRKEEMYDKQEKAKVKKPVVFFDEIPKGLILNTTLVDQIIEATGQEYLEDWPGCRITLYPTTILAWGEQSLVARVREKTEAPADPATHWSNDPAKLGKFEALLQSRYQVPNLDHALDLLYMPNWLSFPTGKDAANAVYHVLQQPTPAPAPTSASDASLLDEYGIDEDDLDDARGVVIT